MRSEPFDDIEPSGRTHHGHLLEEYGGRLDPVVTRPCLTVSDVVKLAAGGVAVKFEDVKDMIVPDGPVQDKIQEWWDTAPTKALIARITMNVRSRPRNERSFQEDPIRMYTALMAAQHGDTVYVFAHYRCARPQMMTDPLHLFPSDALMAQLHLLEEHAKQIPEGTIEP